MSADPSGLDELPFALARASLGFRRFNDLTLRAAGLGRLAPGLATVVHALKNRGSCTVNELLDATHLPNGTLTGLLDKLELGGEVTRVINPRDARSRVMKLTAHGRKLAAQLERRHHQVMSVFRSELSEAEMTELARLLDRATVCMRDFSPPLRRATPRVATSP